MPAMHVLMKQRVIERADSSSIFLQKSQKVSCQKPVTAIPYRPFLKQYRSLLVSSNKRIMFYCVCICVWEVYIDLYKEKHYAPGRCKFICFKNSFKIKNVRKMLNFIFRHCKSQKGRKESVFVHISNFRCDILTLCTVSNQY